MNTLFSQLNPCTKAVCSPYLPISQPALVMMMLPYPIIGPDRWWWFILTLNLRPLDIAIYKKSRLISFDKYYEILFADNNTVLPLYQCSTPDFLLKIWSCFLQSYFAIRSDQSHDLGRAKVRILKQIIVMLELL